MEDRKLVWDKRFLDMADMVASWSRDPSTKVGAVITREKAIVSLGFNGFAQGVEDRDERYQNREVKYQMVIHAEMNAIRFAAQSLDGCTIYITIPPCSRCCSCLIQWNIKEVVTRKPSDDILSRWGDDMKLSEEMMKEAGVIFRYVS